jgi:hypothetical protein
MENMSQVAAVLNGVGHRPRDEVMSLVKQALLAVAMMEHVSDEEAVEVAEAIHSLAEKTKNFNIFVVILFDKENNAEYDSIWDAVKILACAPAFAKTCEKITDIIYALYENNPDDKTLLLKIKTLATRVLFYAAKSDCLPNYQFLLDLEGINLSPNFHAKAPVAKAGELAWSLITAFTRDDKGIFDELWDTDYFKDRKLMMTILANKEMEAAIGELNKMNFKSRMAFLAMLSGTNCNLEGIEVVVLREIQAINGKKSWTYLRDVVEKMADILRILVSHSATTYPNQGFVLRVLGGFVDKLLEKKSVSFKYFTQMGELIVSIASHFSKKDLALPKAILFGDHVQKLLHNLPGNQPRKLFVENEILKRLIEDIASSEDGAKKWDLIADLSDVYASGPKNDEEEEEEEEDRAPKKVARIR